MRSHRSTLGPLRALITVVAVVAATGCGNLTPGGIGTANVFVSGDAPDVSSTQAAAAAASSAGSGNDDQPEGEMRLTFELYLRSENGIEIRLGEELEARVDLEGKTEADAASQRITAIRYERLRIVFIEVEAEVDAGLVIDGDTITGPIDVDIDDPLEVFRAIDLLVLPDDVVELLVDLNAAAWLRAVDPTTATVEPAVFASLIEVVAR